MRSVLRSAAWILALVSSHWSFAAGQPASRPLRTSDLLSVESVTNDFMYQAAFSRDGRAVAFTTVRPIADDPAKWPVSYGDYWHSDVWVQSGSDHAARRITNGAVDGSGWFDPRWSPDGQRLLMGSTRGGSLRLWIWNAVSNELSPVAEQAVDYFRGRDCLQWVGNEAVIFCAALSNERLWNWFPRTEALATAGWLKAWEGTDDSVSVLASGNAGSEPDRNLMQLRLVDLRTGTSSVLTDGEFSSVSVSPNRQWVAVLRSAGARKLSVNEPPPLDSKDGWPEIFDLRGNEIVSGRRADCDTEIGPWSADGNELLYWDYGQSRRQPPRLYRLNPTRKTVAPIDMGSLEPVAGTALWGSKGAIVVLAAAAGDGTQGPPTSWRRDWYVLGANSALNLTRQMTNPPAALYPAVGRSTFVGASDGKLWKLSVSARHGPKVIEFNGVVSNLTPAPSERELEYPDLMLQLSDDSGFDHASYVLNRNTLVVSSIISDDARKLLHPSSLLASYSTRSKDALFYSTDYSGMFINRVSRHGLPTVLRSANLWLQETAPGAVQAVDYESMDGEALVACIILPVGYRAGAHYPMLTWVYPGTVQTKDCQGAKYEYMTPGISHPALNLQLAASRGYVVLFPSMPFDPRGQPADVMSKLLNGVLPAVDRVIAAGVADAHRLSLGGHSFGGYGVYGLITQTDRFGAAVAMSGITDFISLYGTADARNRYDRLSVDTFYPMTYTERYQASLFAPPWKDIERYLRNSPITRVENVRTPLLMIHGDMDFLPMTQAEEFFAALYRQGKPAELARYWGEGHYIRSPANVRDMWNRIFAWLDDKADVSRDSSGELVFEGDFVQSRQGRLALSPAQFSGFDVQ